MFHIFLKFQPLNKNHRSASSSPPIPMNLNLLSYAISSRDCRIAVYVAPVCPGTGAFGC